MNHTKSLLKIVTLAFVVLAAAVAAYLIFRPSTPAATPSDTNKTTKPTLKELPAEEITTEDFTYQKPAGWAKLSKELLDASAATSGIGLPAASSATTLPVASVTVKVAAATPKDNNDLKNSVLTELKKLAKFELVTSTSTKVDGKTGQQFTYTYGDKNKTKQELYVVVNKQKTFFVLSSAAQTEFDTHAEAFTKILLSFKFK